MDLRIIFKAAGNSDSNNALSYILTYYPLYTDNTQLYTDVLSYTLTFLSYIQTILSHTLTFLCILPVIAPCRICFELLLRFFELFTQRQLQLHTPPAGFMNRLLSTNAPWFQSWYVHKHT